MVVFTWRSQKEFLHRNPFEVFKSDFDLGDEQGRAADIGIAVDGRFHCALPVHALGMRMPDWIFTVRGFGVPSQAVVDRLGIIR